MEPFTERESIAFGAGESYQELSFELGTLRKPMRSVKADVTQVVQSARLDFGGEV